VNVMRTEQPGSEACPFHGRQSAAPTASKDSTTSFLDLAEAEILCPFSRAGRHWDAPTLSMPWGSDDYLATVAADLERFLRSLDNWDDYVIPIRGQHAPKDLDAVARCLNWLLRGLSARNPEGVDCMRQPVENKGWWYRFAQQRFFVLVLSDVYPQSHARSCGKLSGTFVVMQPEASFDRALGKLEQMVPKLIDGVRNRFRDAGRPYNPGLSQSPYEIHRYLKPLDPKAGVVRFWSDESPLDAFFRPSETG
jgi:hypothetical protein